VEFFIRLVVVDFGGNFVLVFFGLNDGCRRLGLSGIEILSAPRPPASSSIGSSGSIDLPLERMGIRPRPVVVVSSASATALPEEPPRDRAPTKTGRGMLMLPSDVSIRPSAVGRAMTR